MARPGSPWPSAVEFDERGLAIGGVLASNLAEAFGTPLVVVDEDHLRARCREFKEAFPRVLWAVKAFPLRGLIRVALEEGLGLLAATGGELDACLRADAPRDRIVLHGNNKSDAELAEAARAGVGLLIADNEEELRRISALAERTSHRQQVLLRVAPGIDVETHAYIKTAAPDTKFGTPIAGDLAITALRAAMELPGIDLQGIHIHLGSQLLHARPYLAGLRAGLDLLAEAREALGLEARVLDIGGGMGTRYTEEAPIGVEKLSSAISSELQAGCRERGLPVPELVVEPGRALISGAAFTLYRVGSIKEVPEIRTFVAVDGGMSDNIRPALYGSRYAIALASRRSHAAERTVTIVGRHCESGDVLARDVSVPEDLRRDDLIAFASTGAYEYAMASNYNKVGRPPVLTIAGGRARLIARRETYEDLADLDVD